MIFLLALLWGVSSFGASPGKVVDLTLESWDRLVEKREPDSVWIIMFTMNNCPACKATFPLFQKAAVDADGVVEFGHVRADLEEGLRLRFNIKVLPTFVIVHSGGTDFYNGKRTSRAFVSAAAKYIVDKAAPIEPDWSGDGLTSLMLFTDKKKTPPIWAAISCVFQGKVRVGVTSDSEVAEAFGVTKRPEILMMNQTHKLPYNGRVSFLQLRQTVQDFIDGVYEEPFTFDAEFFLPEEYNEQCSQFNGYCIIHAVDDLDQAFKAAQIKFKSNRLKFFYGADDLPFDFMEIGDLYIFAPHKNAAAKIDSLGELNVALSSVFDGSIKWTPIDELKKK